MVFFLLLVYVYAELITLVALVDVNSIQTPMKLNLKVKLFWIIGRTWFSSTWDYSSSC